jgi:AcrR family transcriptional regulator
MQIQKDSIRQTILNEAEKQFLEKGYKGTSMRTIAANSGVILSNIYNYFKSKDEIFRELLSGVLSAIEYTMEEHNSPDYISIDIFSSDEYMRKQIDMFVGLIENYKEEFNLLLFKSAGSSLENFREEIIERHTQTGKEYIALMKTKYPEINGDVSPFFIHVMSSWWVSIVAELVMHDLSHDELELFIREFMEYGTAGWKKIMKV